jgi:hypothetical protein
MAGLFGLVLHPCGRIILLVLEPGGFGQDFLLPPSTDVVVVPLV